MVMDASSEPHAGQASSSCMHPAAEGRCKSASAAVAEPAGTTVRVALRARPLVARERLEGSKPCITVHEGSGLVVLGQQRQFVFDQAFGPHTPQEQVYTSCVSDLVDAVVEGYNATVLAYGPTGSGKTYTMGTGNALHCLPEQQGIIPRVIKHLFEVIKQADSSRSFVVRAQFLEIYNEEVRDLLAPVSSSALHSSGCSSSGGGSSMSSSFLHCSSSPEKQRCGIAIRECPDGQIIVTGAKEEVASSYEDLVHLLDVGALARATGATALNEQSSRSHAIFTIIVEQSFRIDQQEQQPQELVSSPACSRGNSSGGGDGGKSPLTPRARLLQQLNSSSSEGGADQTAAADGSISPRQQQSSGGSSNSSSISVGDATPGAWPGICGAGGRVEYRCAKFHMVDLAGSERTKRTGAVGARFKETVTINQGLLALGNVISALGDEKRRLPGGHVPYRDSKLTRLLQDSLGGNSKTLMIACVSSVDDALEENLNTLKYASRARHIRNRPVVNRQQLGSSTGGMASDIQALQLLLLRRYAQHVLGPVTAEALPPLLLADVSRCNEASAVQMLRELQSLAALPEEPLSAGAMLGIQQHDHQQQHMQQLQALNQQVSALQAELAAALSQVEQNQELQQGLAGGGDDTVQLTQAVTSAKQQLLHEVEQMHVQGKISQAARKRLAQLLDQQLEQPVALASREHSSSSSSKGTSLQSHPLPVIDASCSSEAAAEAIRAAAAVMEAAAVAAAEAEALSGLDDAYKQHQLQQQQQIEELQQEMSQLRVQLDDTKSQLQTALADLTRDEEIFAERVQQMSKLRDELAAAQQQRREAEQQMQQMCAELRRWQARAMSMQGSPAAAASTAFSELPPSSPASHRPGAPGGVQASGSSLAPELSFAAFTIQQEQPHLQEKGSADLPMHCNGDEADNDSKQASDGRKADAVAHDDQVLFDDELASYISETDYTELDALAFEDDTHLLAELQVVLADKAALEEEKAAAQAEAAAAQRTFERSRMLLEGQLNQLAAAIRSQETLISTLQSNEAEARQLGALYLDRCRELETEIAELNLEMEELTAALARVEADAAASAEEKAHLRAEYKARIKDVVTQMSSLQRQLKGQDGMKLEKERQRAAGRVQQLQAHLTAMQLEQATLKRRLQEKLAAQEKAAAEKAKELASLRKAAEAAKRKVVELEEENRRQRAALRSRMEEALHAQHEAQQARRQLKKLSAQAAVQRSRQSSPCPHKSLHCTHSATCSNPSRPASWSDAGYKSSSSGSSSTANNSSRLLRPHRASPAASVQSSTCSFVCSSDPVQHLPCSALGQHEQQHHGGTEAGCSAGSALQGITCGLRGSSEPVQHWQHLTTKQPYPQHHAGHLRAGGCSCSNGSSTAGRKSLLKLQLEQLISKEAAETALRELQVRHAEVVLQREQLISAKAQLDIKTLRRRCSSTGSDKVDSGTVEQPAVLNTAEQCLLEGLTDQLDASEVELGHLTQQLQKQLAALAAAEAAAADLTSKIAAVGSTELSEMLQQALSILAEQASKLQATVTKASKLEMDLAEQQQQLEEATCNLQSTQLKHQTQLADLQQEHEQRIMAILRQQQQQQAAVAAVAAAARTPISIQQMSRPSACAASGATAAAAAGAAIHRGSAAAAAAALLGAPAVNQNQQAAARPSAAGIVATIAAVFNADESRVLASSSASADGSQTGSREAVGCSSGTGISVRTAERRGSMLSPRSGAPQLSDLIACLAQQPHSQYSLQQQQQQEQALQQDKLILQQTFGTSNAQQQDQQQDARLPEFRDQPASYTEMVPHALQNIHKLEPEPEVEISFACPVEAGGTCSSEEPEEQLRELKFEHQQLSNDGAGAAAAAAATKNDSETSPSKLQAKLAAYRKYLKQASPQKPAAAAAAAATSDSPNPAGAATQRRQYGSDSGPTREQETDARCSSFSDGGVVLQQGSGSSCTPAKQRAAGGMQAALLCSADGCAAGQEGSSDTGSTDRATSSSLRNRVRQCLRASGHYHGSPTAGQGVASDANNAAAAGVGTIWMQHATMHVTLSAEGEASENSSGRVPQSVTAGITGHSPEKDRKRHGGGSSSKQSGVRPPRDCINRGLCTSMQDIRHEIEAAGGAAAIVKQFSSSLTVEPGSLRSKTSKKASPAHRGVGRAAHSSQLSGSKAGSSSPGRCVSASSVDAPLQEAAHVIDAPWHRGGSNRKAPQVFSLQQSAEDNMFGEVDQVLLQPMHGKQQLQHHHQQQQRQ